MIAEVVLSDFWVGFVTGVLAGAGTLIVIALTYGRK
jgi:hypothetical protein